MNREEFTKLEQLPNVGPAIAADLQLIGIRVPKDLPGRDPYRLFDKLCRVSGQKHDPCVIDTFISAVRFMEGERKKLWWAYTAERKAKLATSVRPKRKRA